MTYEIPESPRSPLATRRFARGGLACGLFVLQACIASDVVVPTSESADRRETAPVLGTSPKVTALGPDTLRAGGVLVVEGEHFSAAASIRLTVAGLPLTLRVRSATRLEAVLPLGGYPCGSPVPAPVKVEMGGFLIEETRILQPATRLSLATGQSISLLEPGLSRCVELPAASDGARYVIAVVNTSGIANQAAPFELRGTRVLSGTGVHSAPDRNTDTSESVGAPVTSLLSSSLPLAVRRELEAEPAREASHHQRLTQQLDQLRQWRAAGLMPRAAARAAAATRSTRVGDTLTFTAAHTSCASGQPVRARVVYVGARALVLEDINAVRAGTMDAQYRQLGGEFDSVVYPLLVTNIGDPLAMNARLGGDGRVSMLFTRFVNDSLPGTAGYVSACNFYPRSSFAGSNEDEVFFARVPSAWETPEEWRRAMRATVVHEAKHLASFAERLSRGREFEESWLEEATARIAEEIYARTFSGGGAWKGQVGFASSVRCEVLQCDDRPLVMWKHFVGLHAFLRDVDVMSPLESAGTQAAYGSGWALVRWATDRFAENEADWLRALVRGDAGVGLRGMAHASGLTEQSLLAAWTLALTHDHIEAAGQNPGAGTRSWDMSGMLREMATLFPGVFTPRPLKVTSPADGVSTVVQGALRGGGVRFISLPAGTAVDQRLALTGEVGSPVRISVARVR